MRSLVQQIIADPIAALRREQTWSRSAIGRFCEEIDIVLGDDPIAARRLATIAVRLAKRSGSRCAMARAWCTLGACLRHADRTDDAETCYMLALGEGCRSLRPEIFRRWSLLLLYREQYRQALRLANRSVRGFRRAKDSHGAGRALLARGLARKHCEDREGAYADYCEALSLIPRWDGYYYATALQNLTVWLSSSESTEAQQEEALRGIAQARDSIRKHAGYRVLRTRLRWVEVMIQLRLRRIAPYKARQSLERVVRVLSELGMPQDAAAAAADLATWSERWWTCVSASTASRARHLRRGLRGCGRRRGRSIRGPPFGPRHARCAMHAGDTDCPRLWRSIRREPRS
jgi:tetratricopeptide (TPR) repeat protein